MGDTISPYSVFSIFLRHSRKSNSLLTDMDAITLPKSLPLYFTMSSARRAVGHESTMHPADIADANDGKLTMVPPVVVLHMAPSV